MQPIYVYNAPYRPSGSMLLGAAVVDTLLALMIGFVLSLLLVVPMIAMNWHALGRAFDPPAYTQSFYCTWGPERDDGLLYWARSQRAFDSVEVSRNGGAVSLDYRMKSGDGPGPDAPMASLGYNVAEAHTTRRHIRSDANALMHRLAQLPATAGIVVLSLFASQSGVLLAYAWCIGRTREEDQYIDSFFNGPVATAVLLGLVMGIVGLTLGLAWSMVLERTVGPHVNNDGVFGMTCEFPLWGKLAMILLVTVVAPVGEELFFRGFLFGRYVAAGRVWLGIFVSALCFAAIHMEPLNFVWLFAMGIILAWTYHRTGSLIASMTAHAVNNSVVFAIMFSQHHV